MKKYIHSFSVTCGLYFTVVIFIQSFINVETEPFHCCFLNETTTENNDSTTQNYSQPCCLSCAMNDSVNCSDLNPNFFTLVSDNVSQCQFPIATLPSTIIHTTSTEATTSEMVSTTLRISTQPQQTTTTISASEDEGTVTLCVLQCPTTHYHDEKRQCQRCNTLCKNCTGKGIESQTCECKYGHNGTHCCQEGFQEDIQRNLSVCIKIKQPEDTSDDNIAIIAGAVGGGVAVLVVLIVVIVCFVCRRHQADTSSGRQRRPISQLLHNNKSKKKKKASQLPSAEEVDIITSNQAQTGGTRRPPGYENTATIDHRRVAECAQHEQDKKGRYTKDPTAKKEKKNAKEEDNSPTEIYENQSTIDRQKQLKFEKDKKPGRFQKLSMKFRKSKALKVKTPDPNLPTDTYEEMEGAAEDNNMPTEVYEAALDEHAPQEEYEAMDKKTMEEPQEEYMPMNPQGVDNSAFSVSENPYANVKFRSADSNEPTEDYENFQLKQCDDQPVYGNVG